MSVESLSRLQFAMTVSFHFLFPPMTMGLGIALVVMQTLRVATGKPLYTDLARFWTRVFGMIFAIGVATGIPLEFQFGTNWARYARFVGDIFGSPLALEGVYAFFLESGFLALLLFGWHKIGPKMHLFATAMVALGAHFSAIWIIVANSWMHTPRGFHLARKIKVLADGTRVPFNTDLGSQPFTYLEVPLPADYVVKPTDLPEVRAVVDSFTAAILNPSTVDRLTHTVLACWIVGAFVLVAVAAWWLLRGKHLDFAKPTMKIGLTMATISCLLQMVAGDSTARGVAQQQPTKLAAMEGLAKSERHVGLALFGVVWWERDTAGHIVGIREYAVRVPDLLSLLVTGDYLHPLEASKTEVRGLADLPSDEFLRRRHPGASAEELKRLRPEYWPNVPIVFQSFHLMVAIGVLLTLGALAGALLCWRGKLWEQHGRARRVFLWFLVFTPLLAQIATQAGWFTAELGRQPWIVYEVLKTQDGVSAVVHAGQVINSIILFFMVYLFLTVLFVTMLARKIAHGPDLSPADRRLSGQGEPFSLKAERQTEK